MFGKKRKQAQLEAEQQRQQEALAQQELVNEPILEEVSDDTADDGDLPKEYESIAYILKQEMGDDLQAIPVEDECEELDLDELEDEDEPLEELDEIEELDELEEDESEELVEEEQIEEIAQPQSTSDEHEVVYIVDGPTDDDDELVKPAKLVKLPNLVDYMLSQNMSKKMKINIATLLLTAYNKYKDIPAEKKIVVQCMAKVMRSLMQETQG